MLQTADCLNLNGKPQGKAMNRIVFGILSQLNKLVLPRYSKRQDLTRLKKWEQAIVGWRMWVTYRHLDAQLPNREA